MLIGVLLQYEWSPRDILWLVFGLILMPSLVGGLTDIAILLQWQRGKWLGDLKK